MAGYTWLHAQEAGKSDQGDSFARLTSPDFEVRKQAMDEILTSRSKTVGLLCEMVDQSNAQKYSEETRGMAAYLLGEMRAQEAVKALCSTMANPLFLGPNGDGAITGLRAPYASSYVVVEALSKIGYASVPQMLTNLRESDNETVVRGSISVLRLISNDLARSRGLIDSVLEQEKDEKVKTRLNKAKDTLDGK